MELQSKDSPLVLNIFLEAQVLTSHFAVNDADEDNLEFETGNLFDFTDTDPFSEGDL